MLRLVKMVSLFAIVSLCAALSLFSSVSARSLPKDHAFHSSYEHHLFFNNNIKHLLYTVQTIIEKEMMQTNQTSQLCNKHFVEFISEAKSGTDWALKMIDSMGKPNSGILEGSLSFLGYYSECLKSNGPNFSGKYCLITINLPKRTVLALEKLSDMSSTFTAMRAKIGACMPSTCSVSDINTITSRVSALLLENSSISVGNCYQTKNEGIFNDNKSIAVILLFVILLAIVISGTVCDHIKLDSNKPNSQLQLIFGDNEKTKSSKSDKYQHSDTKAKLNRLLIAFSVKQNVKKILDNNPSDLRVLHGLKFLAMLWVICLHSFGFSLQWMHFRNPEKIKHATRSLLSQLLANGTFSVDCFFFISGFLVSYLVLNDINNGGKFRLIRFYLYRYLKMTPPMMAVIAFSATLLEYSGEGPNWTESITMFNGWCQKNWWLNSLYLHNFVDTSNMCLSHSWYSAVDMQFYLMAPLILIPLYKFAYIGIAIALAFLSASMAITAYLTLTQHYPAVPYFNDLIAEDIVAKYYSQVYIKPYCRIGPYLVGIVLAHSIITSEGNIKMKKIYSILGWVTALLVSLGVLFAMMPAMNDNIPGVYIAALYSATSRTIWSLSLAWIVFACIAGHGGVVNWFLSLRLWTPLSRLSYCAYLVHPIVMAMFYGSQTNTFDYSALLLIYFTISHLFITYALSFILSLTIELPFATIAKFLMKRTLL